MRFKTVSFKRSFLYIILLSVFLGGYYTVLFLLRPNFRNIEMICYLLMPLPPFFCWVI